MAFKKQYIETRTAEKSAYRMRLESKKTAFKELLSFISPFIELNEQNTLRTNIYNNVITAISDKYAALFPTLTINKICELHSFDLNKLESLINAYQSIEINEDIEPEFDIFTENENENQRLEITKTLIADIEKLGSIVHVYPAPLITALNNSIAFDFKTNRLKPNIYFIKNKAKRH